MFILSNIKAIIFGILFIVFMFFGYKFYSIIVENTENRIKIQQLEESLVNKNQIIELQKNDILIREQIVIERDNSIKELEKKYEDIVNNLGDDENDLAPKSLQELMKRLNK